MSGTTDERARQNLRDLETRVAWLEDKMNELLLDRAIQIDDSETSIPKEENKIGK